MGWRARLTAAALMLTPGMAIAQAGEARGVVSCGTGRQIVYFAGPDDVVTRATVDGRSVELPSGAPLLGREMEAYCGPGSPADALAVLRANTEMNAGDRIRQTAPSTDNTTRAMDAALGTPSPHPLATPPLPKSSPPAQKPDPEWEDCAREPDPAGCRAALMDARQRDDRGLLQSLANAWREGEVAGLIRLAHESWLLYGLLAVAALVAVPRLLRRRG